MLQEGRLASSGLEAQGCDLSLVWEEKAPDVAEEGGFACAVASEKSADRSRPQPEVESGEYGSLTIGKVKVDDVYHGVLVK